MQAARDFAVALVDTSQYQAYQNACEGLDQDSAAQEIIQTFLTRQKEMQISQSLGIATEKDREAFEQLRQAMQDRPSISAYLQAQASLASICQAAGDLLYEHTGINFGSSACSSGCCG